MKTIGNILWFLFVGLASGVAWFCLGILLCITLIGIPFGKQCFKIARVTVWPFGTTVATYFGKHPIANVIWLVLCGAYLAISYAIAGVLCCITIIGIPFGKQCFKLAGLAAIPFGATIS